MAASPDVSSVSTFPPELTPSHQESLVDLPPGVVETSLGIRSLEQVEERKDDEMNGINKHSGTGELKEDVESQEENEQENEQEEEDSSTEGLPEIFTNSLPLTQPFQFSRDSTATRRGNYYHAGEERRIDGRQERIDHPFFFTRNR